MKPETLIFILVTAITVYFVTSNSNKTTGRVTEYSTVSLPALKDSAELVEEVHTPQTLTDLTLPQLMALDPETENFIQQSTASEPEETAEWALKIENDFARFKVLRFMLYKWADQSPKTCASWVEQIPEFDKKLDLYITVARSWASSAPTAAIDEYRSIDKDTKKPKYREFIIPLTKAILQVWATKSPDLAASWVTQTISDQNERKEFYPVIMHAWFENSYPNRLFSWLIQFKYDEPADLDSIFIMQQWVKKDSTGPFEWLSKQLKNDYIDELSDVASVTLAEKDLKTCEQHINNPAFTSLKSNLIEAITVRTSGKDDSQALAALSKLTDLALVDSIATKSAMQLVGKDDDALLYVKSTGFLTFPKLESYFLEWTQADPRKVLNWLKMADYNEFAADYFDRTVKEWNLEPGNKAVPEKAYELTKIYIRQKPDLINKPIPVDTLPVKLAEKFQKGIASWNLTRVEIIQKCAALWAQKNFDEVISFALADKSSIFTSVCLRGCLPNTPEKTFNETYKKLEQLSEDYPVKELFSYLALSKAEKAPGKTLEILKKKGIAESQFVIQTIDRSIKDHREELRHALDRSRLSNIHIYFPYFFYQYTRLDPANAYKTLGEYNKKTWHNSALKAIAASYKDHHLTRADNWVKSLSGKDRETISGILP